jgi:hypothetical protein
MERGLGDVRGSLQWKRREKAHEDDAYIFVMYLSVWTKVSFLMQAVRQRKAASAGRTFDAWERCARISQCDLVGRLRLEQAIQRPIQSYPPATGTVLSSGRLELTLALCVTATLVLLLNVAHIAS